MFEAEATWLERLLRQWAPEQLSPLLNVGSSTREFRETTQPWTDRQLFRPLRERGIKLVHLDSRDGDGIDIRADILSDADLPRIMAFRPKAILCCNILEHVREPESAGAPLHRDRGARRADLRHRAAQLSASSRSDRHDVPSGAR